MKKINFKNIFSFCLISITLFSCRSVSKISNGAYSDLSLNLDSKEYSIKRLNEITKEEKAIFGIPLGKKVNKSNGIVVRFNGVTISSGNKILPTLSMIGLSLAAGYGIQAISGFKQENIKKWGWHNSNGQMVEGPYNSVQKSSEHNLNLGVASLIALPIAAVINNQIWNSALGRAAFQVNSQLLLDNDDIDVFLNPKYEIETTKGLFIQKAKIRLRPMGAKILTGN
jgi:hypothetical protein